MKDRQKKSNYLLVTKYEKIEDKRKGLSLYDFSSFLTATMSKGPNSEENEVFKTEIEKLNFYCKLQQILDNCLLD